jgi:hypothetical protein
LLDLSELPATAARGKVQALLFHDISVWLIARRALLKIDLSVGYVVSDLSPTFIITNKRVLKRQAWRKSGFSLDINLIFH